MEHYIHSRVNTFQIKLQIYYYQRKPIRLRRRIRRIAISLLLGLVDDVDVVELMMMKNELNMK